VHNKLFELMQPVQLNCFRDFKTKSQ